MARLRETKIKKRTVQADCRHLRVDVVQTDTVLAAAAESLIRA